MQETIQIKSSELYYMKMRLTELADIILRNEKNILSDSDYCDLNNIIDDVCEKLEDMEIKKHDTN